MANLSRDFRPSPRFLLLFSQFINYFENCGGDLNIFLIRVLELVSKLKLRPVLKISLALFVNRGIIIIIIIT